jgi:hypothetical protein
MVLVYVMTFFTALSSADNLSRDKYMRKNVVPIAFSHSQSLDGWQITSDVVMGGVSVGQIELKGASLVFSGDVSTENYGGFTSVFKKIASLPSHIKSVTIQIKGDGNVYQMRVRSQVAGYKLAYKVDFDTKKGRVHEYTFNLADFKASFRGRNIANAPILEASYISHVGFLIKAKQSKSFNLSIQTIEFY